MADGRRTVNPIHKKRRGFESLLSHKNMGSHVPMAGVSPLQGESGGFNSLRVHKNGFNQ